MAEVNQVILCPYCGHTQTNPGKCESCGGFFDQLSLRATQVSMGPWFIRDKKRPYRPGCSYEILKKQISAGKIKPNSILRGPTTRQFWSVARNVPGVAHLLGVCHQCGKHVKSTDPKCIHCSAPFRDVALRNEMGLFYPTEAAAQSAQKAIEREVANAGSPKPAPSPAAPASPVAPGPGSLNAAPTVVIPPVPPATPEHADAAKNGGGEDLLDEVLDRVAKQTQGVKAVDASRKPDPKAGKRRAPTMPPPDPIAASGLNFDPVDDDGQELESDRRTSRGPGMPTFLLIGLIVVVLAVQLMFAVLWFTQKGAASSGSSGNSGGSTNSASPDKTNSFHSSGKPDQDSGSNDDSSPAPKADDGPKPGKPGADSDDLLRRTYGTSQQPTAPVVTNRTQDEMNPLSPNYKPPVLKPKDAVDTTTDADNSSKSASKNSDNAATDAPKPVPKPKGDTITFGTIEARMARAKFLEGQKKYADSLAILKELAKTVPLAKQPADLDESIRRVEGLIATQKTGNFFKTE